MRNCKKVIESFSAQLQYRNSEDDVLLTKGEYFVTACHAYFVC